MKDLVRQRFERDTHLSYLCTLVCADFYLLLTEKLWSLDQEHMSVHLYVCLRGTKNNANNTSTYIDFGPGTLLRGAMACVC